jgi:hypothetical protein
VVFAVWRSRPETFGGLATNPNVPPEVGAALLLSSGWMTRLRYATPLARRSPLAAMLHYDWAFSLVSRINE